MRSCDAVVIGGGIAGVSAAYALSVRGADVVVLEREDSLTAHSTGRSAAQYIETYGGEINQALTVASREFLSSDADGWADDALLTRRPVLWAAGAAQLVDLERHRQEMSVLSPGLVPLDAHEAREYCPVLSPVWVAGALLEADSYDIDVAGSAPGVPARRPPAGCDRGALQSCDRHGAVRGALAGAYDRGVVRRAGRRGRGGCLGRRGRPHRRRRDGGSGTLATHDLHLRRSGRSAAGGGVALAAGGRYRRRLLLQARGTLAIARLAGRRDAGRSLATPAPPNSTWHGEIDAVNAATTLGVRAVRSVWAGLRTFAPDRHPVVSFDDAAEGFVWCAGQGGTGIQTSPAIGEVIASIVCGTPPPEPLAGLIDGLAPRRPRPTD